MGLVICESQQFQSTLIQEVMRDYPFIPIEGKKADVDKVTRARAVAAKYEANKIFHHPNLRDTPFESELLSFPKGHDDFVDALGYSLDLGGSGFVFGALRR
jgi:predicted phage terminase large subunit-like protein